MKKILFPFQLKKDVYKEAYISAVKFARNMNAELILLNTFAIEADESITRESYDWKIKEKWLHAYKEVSMYNEYYLTNHARVDEYLKVRTDHRFIHGREINELKTILSEEKIDLLILPLSDDTKQNKKYLELINDDLFTSKETSVLLIPRGYTYQKIRRIAYTTDLKEHIHMEFYLEEILKYTRVFDASVHFVHVVSGGKRTELEDNEIFRQIMKIIEQHKQHHFQSIPGKDISKTILEYANTHDINLISVIKDELALVSSFFHRSISKELLEDSKIPILYMVEKTAIDSKKQ